MDCVFVAERSGSLRAADREQFYVSASRFKESLTIFTDDKRQLLEAVRKSWKRPAALDSVLDYFVIMSEMKAFLLLGFKEK
jgi:hypothetical protein